MARAAEFRAIEEALTGALKFFDTRPSAQDTHLGDALARGAAPKLNMILIDKNLASDAAQQAVRDALENRK